MEMDGTNVQSEIENQSLIVDIKDMKDMLREVSSISEHPCIYRVPKPLRDTNEAAYVPELVSLGPFHHGKEGLEAMEKHKRRCFEGFIGKHNVDLAALLMLMKGLEEKTRRYYADDIKLPSKKFVQVILVDAIFVINFLLQVVSHDSAIDVRSIYHENFFLNHVFRDMMLLENQLPLSILEEILDFVKRTADPRITLPSFLDLSEFIFTAFMEEGTDRKSDSKELNGYDDAEHFVDFQRLFYMPKAEKLDPTYGQFQEIKSISKLHKAGVRLSAASGKKLFDIKFEHGLLEIPLLVVNEWTEIMFRNLLAYDLCHYGPSPISDYFKLMGMLIDTADDVEILVKNKILRNHLSTDQEVSKLFNSLEKEVDYRLSSYTYAKQCYDIHKYCEIPWHKWMAALKQNYLDTPWKVISLIAAFILLVLTLIQTVCSVISF